MMKLIMLEFSQIKVNCDDYQSFIKLAECHDFEFCYGIPNKQQVDIFEI